MTIKLHAGIVDVTLHYTLTPTAESTRVTRVVTLGVPWSLKLLQPLLVRAFRVESGSTLLGLKAYRKAALAHNRGRRPCASPLCIAIFAQRWLGCLTSTEVACGI